MRVATPVILTDAVGNRDVVENGVSGILVPVDDVAALAGGISRLLKDREMAAVMGAAGRDRLAKMFDVRQMGSAHVALYGEMARH
jgi:glycosyltransferase involved in cell wall biosynthesis